jgi:hypothetical protein
LTFELQRLSEQLKSGGEVNLTLEKEQQPESGTTGVVSVLEYQRLEKQLKEERIKWKVFLEKREF